MFLQQTTYYRLLSKNYQLVHRKLICVLKNKLLIDFSEKLFFHPITAMRIFLLSLNFPFIFFNHHVFRKMLRNRRQISFLSFLYTTNKQNLFHIINYLFEFILTFRKTKNYMNVIDKRNCTLIIDVSMKIILISLPFFH